MQDLPQPLTTKCGQKKAGRRLGSVPSNKLPLLLPELVGKTFGKLKVISETVIRKGVRNRPNIYVQCTICGEQSVKDYTNLVRCVAGCRKCGQPRHAPKWLVSRASSAKERCTNPRNQHYCDYGGRGIKFLFETPTAMAVWVQENLGLHKEMEIDRINNDGHYEPGNLRYLSRTHNQLNKRGLRPTARLHVFRQEFPQVKYSDATIVRMIGEGMSYKQIVEKFNQPSFKPKGVYGTFSTPDPDIVLLSKDFWSQTA